MKIRTLFKSIIKLLLFINWISVVNGDKDSEIANCTRSCLLTASNINSSGITHLNGDLVKQIIEGGQIETCRSTNCTDYQNYPLWYALLEVGVACDHSAKSDKELDEWRTYASQTYDKLVKNGSDCRKVHYDEISCNDRDLIIRCGGIIMPFCKDKIEPIMVPLFDDHCSVKTTTTQSTILTSELTSMVTEPSISSKSQRLDNISMNPGIGITLILIMWLV